MISSKPNTSRDYSQPTLSNTSQNQQQLQQQQQQQLIIAIPKCNLISYTNQINGKKHITFSPSVSLKEQLQSEQFEYNQTKLLLQIEQAVETKIAKLEQASADQLSSVLAYIYAQNVKFARSLVWQKIFKEMTSDKNSGEIKILEKKRAWLIGACPLAQQQSSSHLATSNNGQQATNGNQVMDLETTEAFMRYRQVYRHTVIQIWCQKYLLRELIDGQYQQVIAARNYFSELITKLNIPDREWLDQIARVATFRLCTHIKQLVLKFIASAPEPQGSGTGSQNQKEQLENDDVRLQLKKAVYMIWYLSSQQLITRNNSDEQTDKTVEVIQVLLLDLAQKTERILICEKGKLNQDFLLIAGHLRLTNQDPKRLLKLPDTVLDTKRDLEQIIFRPQKQSQLNGLLDMQNRSFDSIKSRELKNDLADLKRQLGAWYAWDEHIQNNINGKKRDEIIITGNMAMEFEEQAGLSLHISIKDEVEEEGEGDQAIALPNNQSSKGPGQSDNTDQMQEL